MILIKSKNQQIYEERPGDLHLAALSPIRKCMQSYGGGGQHTCASYNVSIYAISSVQSWIGPNSPLSLEKNLQKTLRIW